jgi:hypothetical protein
MSKILEAFKNKKGRIIMKKLLILFCIFTALTFLVLTVGEIAQSNPGWNKIKEFKTDDGKGAIEARKNGTSKGEINYTEGNVDVEVTVTNPCTYVRVGNTYYKVCY